MSIDAADIFSEPYASILSLCVFVPASIIFEAPGTARAERRLQSVLHIPFECSVHVPGRASLSVKFDTSTIVSAALAVKESAASSIKIMLTLIDHLPRKLAALLRALEPPPIGLHRTKLYRSDAQSMPRMRVKNGLNRGVSGEDLWHEQTFRLYHPKKTNARIKTLPRAHLSPGRSIGVRLLSMRAMARGDSSKRFVIRHYQIWIISVFSIQKSR